jgi:(heptosyl)LPS beta-1,4-glucosyltransferase
VPKLSVTVITLNESARLAAALESVTWADEIVVVDAMSMDDTATVARRFTDRVVVREWAGYAAQKNFAASIAVHDWILSLDADERVTPELASEIKLLMAGGEPPARGYRVPRVAFHLGRWIRSTDWYPDPQLRLYDRRAGAWQDVAVHESVVVRGPVAKLRGELQHYAYRNVSHHLETIDRYTTLAARQMQADGRKAMALDLTLAPAGAFVRNYLLRGGIGDGAPGLIISLLNSYYVLLKFVKLWEMQKAQEEMKK